MPDNTKILVVGTTSDYIEWIRMTSPGRALFLTDKTIRTQANEPLPSPEEEILCDLEDIDDIRQLLLQHLQRWSMTVGGVACFDCESMELSATLAAEFGLLYSSPESIRLCRDKHGSKVVWHGNQLKCPTVRLINTADEAGDFVRETGRPCVLKPLTGSGSELVFCCRTEHEAQQGVRTIQQELRERKKGNNRLFPQTDEVLVAEEWIEGREYSCDFRISGNQVWIIRLTRKVHHPSAPFGTTMAYIVSPSCKPPECREGQLEEILLHGAAALGIDQAICMVDFIINDEGVFLIEMTPRPGGDCIPNLIRHACGLDTLQLNLDFADRRRLKFPSPQSHGTLVGLRIHGDQAGLLASIDSGNLHNDSRIKEINLTRKPGHRISLPPEDYDSWYLGHIIFQPQPEQNLEEQCMDIRRQLTVEVA